MGRKAGGGKVEIPQKERARDFHFPTTPTAAAGFLTEPISNPPALDTVSHSYTSMPPEGYDVGRLYHREPGFDTSLHATYDLRDHAEIKKLLLPSSSCAQREGPRSENKHREEERRNSLHPARIHISFAGGAAGNFHCRSASLPG